MEKAIFAGGCFWCMVEPFDELPGIIEVVSGYTGGKKAYPFYEEVITGQTGHVEAVEITYDETIITYEKLLEMFWQQIDPTDDGGQFADRGDSYKTAIFYTTDAQKAKALASKQALIDSKRFKGDIVTPILEAKPFYKAEAHHQAYHKRNALHYNLYKKGSGRKAFIEEHWKVNKDKKTLKKTLSPIAFHVTQENGTEKPFDNAYYNNFEDGIYVDIVSGEPLFSSLDQYDAGCGWPSFTKPIRKIKENIDRSHGMNRIEVRSVQGDSHLGHVFDDGPKEKGGLRYCINSAALRFIPYEKLEQEGYKEYKMLFNND